jgi:xanthine dehydrogenase accessory factor
MSDSDWSAPETEVLDRARDVLDGDERGVLATIVDVEGSAYRRPGAKMVVPEDGAGVGHITAGCLEGEVQDLAAEVLATGRPRVETYDLRPDAEDDVWGLGVGCNGVLDILLEPIDESYRPVVDAVDAGRAVGVVTVVDADDPDATGARAYYDPREGAFATPEGTAPPAEFPVALEGDLADVVADLTGAGRADSVTVDGTTVFVDGLAPPEELLVVGTGHDVGPVVDVGKRAGFSVTVVGFRGVTATEDRFPAADEVVATSPANLGSAVDLDGDTYAVVATHNFVDDRLAVESLLESPVAYVGLMGPPERFEEMRDEFRAEGTTFEDDQLDRLYTPVGLDLGGGSPHQIALSIVGEVLAVANGRSPRHLREREGSIHERVELSPED